jgi:hypothetical protein
MEKEYDLADLILTRKGSRSYERLSKDCGGNPTANRLQQLATKGLNEFPTPDTIRGMSRGLGATVTDVTMACARSLDLNVRSGDPDALVLNGAGALPLEAQEVIQAVTRQMLNAWRAAVEAEADAAEARGEPPGGLMAAMGEDGLFVSRPVTPLTEADLS